MSEGLSRKVVGGAGLTASGVLLSRGITFASYLVLARLAAPEVFGAFAAGSVMLGTASLFVESGMLAALIQRRDRIEEATHTAFCATVVGGVILALLSLAASPLIGLIFSSHQVGEVAAVMSGTLVLRALTVVPDALLQRRFSFLRRMLVDPLGVMAFGITGIAALSAGMGVWGLVLATYASELAQVVAAWTSSRFKPKPRLASFTMWRELARYGRHVLAGTFINNVGLTANTFLLGRFVSTSALGQYRYATRFASLPQDLAVSAGSYVLLPAFSRISHEHDRLERAVQRSMRSLLAVVVPFSFILLPLGTPLVVLLLGGQWRPAGEALALLSLGNPPQAAGSVVAESLKAAGRPDVLPRLHLLQVVLSVVLMLALLPLGLMGIAAGVALSYILAEAYAVVRATRVHGFHLGSIGRGIWPPYLAGIVMVAVLFPLDRLALRAEQHGVIVGLAVLALEALLGGTIYLASLRAFSPTTAREIDEGVRRVWTRIRERRPVQTFRLSVQPRRNGLARVLDTRRRFQTGNGTLAEAQSIAAGLATSHRVPDHEDARTVQRATAADTQGVGRVLSGSASVDELADLGSEPFAQPSAESTAAFRLGVQLADQGDFAEAEAAYRRADACGHPAAACNLGALLESRGRLSEAEGVYRRGHERGDPSAGFNLGALLEEQGRLSEAEEVYRRVTACGDIGVAAIARDALAILR